VRSASRVWAANTPTLARSRNATTISMTPPVLFGATLDAAMFPAFFVHSRKWFRGNRRGANANCADTPKTTPVGTAPALKWGTPGPPALEASAPGWVLGASDREQRVDVSERAEFPANAICSRLSGAGQTNQGSVIIVSSRHSRMGFFHDNCQGQDFEHRSVVGFSREIGVFRRPFQKGSDRDRTEQPRMARREVAWLHTRRAATEPADPTGPGRAGADLPANA
jgi:hypothetical protein